MSLAYRLILASQSPRRKELLNHLNLPFDIVPSQVEEVSSASDPVAYSLDIALLKGRDILQQKKNEAVSPLIVSADTIVVLDKVIYGKPKDHQDAYRILKLLSGKTHSVFTSVALLTKTEEKTFTVESQVTFDVITESILEAYLNSKDPMDKAGAYGIQGSGLTFISSLNGSYSNVVGFPLSDFVRELAQFLKLDLQKPDWRSAFI